MLEWLVEEWLVAFLIGALLFALHGSQQALFAALEMGWAVHVQGRSVGVGTRKNRHFFINPSQQVVGSTDNIFSGVNVMGLRCCAGVRVWRSSCAQTPQIRPAAQCFKGPLCWVAGSGGLRL